VLLPTPGRNQATLREHRAILAALEGRDPAKAAAAMGAHLDQGMSELRKFAAAQPELFEP
jgi:DNA-binding GntR family transcriptional regulator